MFTREMIDEANRNLNKVDIKGKNYVQVCTRIGAFRKVCPGGVITTEIVSLNDGVVTMKAIVSDDDGKIVATGYAQEKESASYINKTSFIENCETSAVGRALGFLGIGVDESMASAEELVNAVLNQGSGNGGKSNRSATEKTRSGKSSAKSNAAAKNENTGENEELATKEQKTALINLAKELEIDINVVLEKAGVPKGGKMTRLQYGMAANYLNGIAAKKEKERAPEPEEDEDYLPPEVADEVWEEEFNSMFPSQEVD